MRRLCTTTLALLLLGAGARLAGAACPEVSAPGSAPPLTVARTVAGSLALAWEETGADRYWVQAGSLGSLARGAWDHVGVVDAPVATAGLPTPPGAAYFLVQGVCDEEIGATGSGSDGVPRPTARRIAVDLGVEGGEGIFGVHVGVELPAGAFALPGTFTTRGPFQVSSSGLDGLRLLSAGGDLGTPEGLVSFTFFVPDPGFSAPTPVEVLRFEADFLGPLPAPEDLVLSRCDIRDSATEPVAGANCLVTGLVELTD